MRPAVAPYLVELRKLPFVESVAWLPARRPEEDARVEVRTRAGKWALTAEVKTSHLGPATVRDFIARSGRGGHGRILFAPFVSRPSAEALATHGLNFVDLRGNHRLALGSTLQSSAVGRPALRPRGGAGAMRLAGHKVLFALLVRPALVAAPARAVAEAAGTSKNAAAELLRRLEDERLLVRTSTGRRLVGERTLRSRWVASYPTAMRPQLLLGRYELPEREPEERERRLETALGREPGWAFGGGTGAYRLVPHLRVPETTLVVADADLLERHVRELRLVPARDGSLVVFRAPGPLAFEGTAPRVVHPLLVYAELLAGDDERATEAAAALAERHLAERG